MTMAIVVDHVSAVLLSDGWHKVDFEKNGNSTFTLDSYDYIQLREGDDPEILHSGGNGGICATWLEKSSVVCCPLTSILAVRTEEKAASKSKRA